MEATLIEVATTQGIWVLLFVSLFIYTIKRYEAMESLLRYILNNIFV